MLLCRLVSNRYRILTARTLHQEAQGVWLLRRQTESGPGGKMFSSSASSIRLT